MRREPSILKVLLETFEQGRKKFEERASQLEGQITRVMTEWGNKRREQQTTLGETLRELQQVRAELQSLKESVDKSDLRDSKPAKNIRQPRVGAAGVVLTGI